MGIPFQGPEGGKKKEQKNCIRVLPKIVDLSMIRVAL